MSIFKKIFLILMLLIVPGCQKFGADSVKINSDAIKKIGVEKSLQIKTDNKSNILAYKDVDVYEFNKETGEDIFIEKVKLYDYISDVEVPAKTIVKNGNTYEEEYDKRKQNSVFFKINDNEYVARIQAGRTMYKVGKKWYQTLVATTTIDAFNKQMGLEEYEEAIMSSFIGVAYAVDVDAGYDAYCSIGLLSTWAAVHDASACASVNYGDSGVDAIVNRYTSGYIIRRAFYSYDTSGIGSGATVTSASMWGYGKEKADSDDYDYAVVDVTPATENTLITDDYDQFGTTLGSSYYDIGTFTTGGWNEIVLNSTGMGWINTTGYTSIGIRLSADIVGSDPGYPAATKVNDVSIRSLDYSGGSVVSYLEITYTTGGGGGTETTFIPDILFFN